ncbi:hypothetical protein SAMN05428642_102309 [Flaviramulus basaltis]|uniref:DUF3971 domain-containing protein n=1 Tax=Flaviramulus basaltis TaxID=369401 RepID=A0A1K2IHM6_9FLAO|nr:hypothetical protein [Flaviramulus basaltis]SFZ91770.1 hypothetical protein SAMN05428642_102309 [Flaviramulus basaltis]
MNKRLKKTLVIIVGLIVFLFFGVLIINNVIENKLQNQLENISENVEIKYENIKVNSLKGSVNISKPLISVYGKTTHKKNALVELEYFLVGSFSYWDYFFNDKITIGNVIFDEPNITYHHNDSVSSKSYNEVLKNKLNQIIQIESIQINNGNVEVYNVSNDSLILKSENLNFNINAIEVNQKKEKNQIIYKDFKATSNNLIYKLNAYENLYLDHVDFRTDLSKLKGVRLKTKYAKEELSNIIKVQRDHFDLTIDSIEVKKQDFGFQQDSLFYFKSQRIDFYHPNFKIYRDKLIADDLSYKPLYSKMLRDLIFNMNLNSVFINNGSIIYSEKVQPNTQGGRLLFSKLNAKINNLSNTYNTSETVTSVNIESVFMDDTNINVQWDFDVNNTTDEFIYKAEIGKLRADSMNQFMEPNLNIRLKGEIIKTYFTINGNDETSQVDLKLKYDDFDIIVLKENGKEKNKFLSGLVNLLISNDSHDNSGLFRYGSGFDIERNKNKSIFNYLWINIKDGLLGAMLGNGKKDNN